MTKEKILAKINKAIKEEENNNLRNSMGCSEAYYNPYYLIGSCFSMDELSNMSQKTLDSLIKLAEFASDVFY